MSDRTVQTFSVWTKSRPTHEWRSLIELPSTLMNAGLATLVAEAAAGGRTRLTRVAHKAPARLLPMRSPRATEAGAAVCAIGSFGGGLLGGDHVTLDVRAEPGSTLTLTTQASTKVYRTKTNGQPARQDLHAQVRDEALLVYTPDPLVPFAKSSFFGKQRFELSPRASLVAVDWLGAGRAVCGERWAFDRFASRTEVCVGGNDKPTLVEALSLPSDCHARRAASFDVGGVERDAAVSVVVSGPRTQEVSHRLHAAAAALAQRRSGRNGVRDARDGVPSVLHDEALEQTASTQREGLSLESCLLGDLLMGVSEVQPSSYVERVSDVRAKSENGDCGSEEVLTIARIVAQHSEDVYRLLHYCLAPLGSSLGVVPYTDRIHATIAALPPKLTQQQMSGGRTGIYRAEKWRRAPVLSTATIEATQHVEDVKAHSTSISDSQVMRLVHLCDATLPTGGFAHSGGLEAAMQLGLLGTVKGSRLHDSLRQMAAVAIASSVQQQLPFAHATHALMSDALPSLMLSDPDAPWPTSRDERTLADGIQAVNSHQHAVLVPNAPACRASLQLGASLARIARSWLAKGAVASVDADSSESTKGAARGALSLQLRGGVHGAPALGVLAALLEIPAPLLTDAYIYTSSRDLLSAAVRLNLVGPLAAVSLQQQVISDVVAHGGVRDVHNLTYDEAAGSAPLLEAVHACHDLLERRIFMT